MDFADFDLLMSLFRRASAYIDHYYILNLYMSGADAMGAEAEK